MARIVGKLAEKFLGVALPVSNIPGSSGNSGMANVLAAKADGYTVATYIADTLGTIPSGTARHKISDFEWIVRTQVARPYLFVKTDSPYKTDPGLAEVCQGEPGETEGGGHRLWNRR